MVHPIGVVGKPGGDSTRASGHKFRLGGILLGLLMVLRRRRETLIRTLTIVQVLAFSLMTAVGADTATGALGNDAMIFKSSSGDWWWDPSILWYEGQYNLFSMLKLHGSKLENSVLHATSADGVHWVDHGAVITSTVFPANQIFKMYVARCGDRFIMDHGALSKPDSGNDTLRFYESRNLSDWSYIGENHPDPKYYVPQGRWDHMYILPKEEGNPAAGFWGYAVANPNRKMIDEGRGFGMMESSNGREWTRLPPPKVDCGRYAPINFLEIGGCERLAGKYYLIGGFVGVLGQFSYSEFTFVADSPTGPFKLDQDAWRLCGSSGYPGNLGVQFLASFARGNGEILFSQYISTAKGTWPAKEVWLVPLKRPPANGILEEQRCGQRHRHHPECGQ